MRKKLLSISLFLVLSMFMTSCIYFEVPVQDDEDAPNATHVAWRTYITHKPYIYEDVSEDELEINTITFYVENGVWTTEYRNSIDTIKKMVYFDYTFDKPHGTIYIGENEWLDESYSFTCDEGLVEIILYSHDDDTLRFGYRSGW